MTAGRNFPLNATQKQADTEQRPKAPQPSRTDLYHSGMSLKACANSVLCFNRTAKRKPDDYKKKKVNGLREEFNISIAPFICSCWWTLKYVLTEGGEGDLHTELVCSERESQFQDIQNHFEH